MSSTTFTANERSWAISLISDINGFLTGKSLSIKKADGERTINTGAKRMFPDVMLYGDFGKNQLLQGWEIKMPDVAITDSAFIKDGLRKAINLNLNSFFLWNFSYGALYVRGVNNTFAIYKTWDTTKYITTRDDVKTYEDAWKKLVFDIILEINALFSDSTLRCADLGDIISDSIMEDIIARNKNILSDNLKSTSLRDGVMRSSIEVWWGEFRAEYVADENEPYPAYAKVILLSWVNRILFAHMIKRFHNPAKKVEDITYTTTPSYAIALFKAITEECDFFNIFKNIDYSHCLPQDTWNDIVEFNGFLKTSDVDLTDYSALQKILENTVATSKRAIIGQYTTPKKLAALLVKMSMHNITGHFADTCCGSGTISAEALKYKKSEQSIKDSCATTWASDKNSFPLQLTNLSMTAPNAMNIPYRIFQADLFELNHGQIVHITDPTTGEVLPLDLPKFDTVSSNLPFVSSNRESNKKEGIIRDIVNTVKEDTGIVLSARNDLYTFMLFKIKDLLAENGTVGVITSNSWLGTTSGRDLFNAIRWYYHVKGIYITNSGRWFENADVVACILVLEKKETASPDDQKLTNFGVIQKKLEDITESDTKSIVNTSILSRELDSSVMTISSHNNTIIDSFLNLNISLNAVFHKIGWLDAVSKSLVDMNSLMDVFRGIRTGQDEIFYLSDKSVVDAEFVKKGLKNSSNCNGFLGVPDVDILYCDKTMAQLRALGHNATINWLSRFSSSLNTSLAARGENWHMLPTNSFATLFTGMNPYERIFVGKFSEPTIINQRLIGLNPKEDTVNVVLVHALLNSMIGVFYIEAVGFGRGLGVLDFSKNNFEKIKMLDPALLDESKITLILEAFKPIMERDILKTNEELYSEDRINFEKVVLEVYGLLKYFEEIKESILSMQKARLSVRD